MKCIVSSPILSRSGYGDHARSIAKALIKSEKFSELWFIPMPWGNTPTINIDPNNPDHAELSNHLIRTNEFERPDVWIQMTIPNEFQANGTRLNIGITAGIETTLTTKDWIDGLNRMDLILATSEFTKRVFQANKFEEKTPEGNRVRIIECSKPIEVLFEGLNLDIYKKSFRLPNVDLLLKPLPEFCFLFVGHWLSGNLGHDRKDIGMLIKTFVDTFKRRKKRPALVLKTSLAGFSFFEQDVIEDRIEQIYDLIRSEGWKGDMPEIFLINGEFTDQEMCALYNHPKIKAMVSFTHGEGFGRPLLEFTITGKPVIAPNWSGQQDFLNPKYAILLPGELTPVDKSAQNNWIVDQSQWFRVNYPYASTLLLQVFDEYEIFLERSRKHTKFTIDTFSEEKMFEKFLEILNKYINLEEIKPPQVLHLPKLKKIN